MYSRFEIALTSADTLLVFGGLFGVISAIAVASVLVPVSRALRGAVLFGLLLVFSGGNVVTGMALMSGPVPETADKTVIVLDSIQFAFFLFSLLVGAFVLVNRLQWFFVFFFLHFALGLYTLTLSQQVIPVWITSFEVMFELIVGIAAIFLLRPERRSIFDD
ncbi:hypothetical protein [Hirschia litorea]|uniref:DUF4386 domain-containing protein n=1 Tax=Hirschia litorea TaxID=1199156 RepID=A0ABW2IGU5_9PROT